MDKKEIEKQKSKFNDSEEDNLKKEKSIEKNIPDDEIIPLDKSRYE